MAASARDAFGVLRRPQTTTDRSLAAPLIRAVGAGNQVDGVQADGIRAVGNGWALVPAKAMQTTPSARANQDVLCLTDGSRIGCSPSGRAQTTGLQLISASENGTMIAGLVPDGVTRVHFAPDGGSAEEVGVSSNFFSLAVPQSGPKRMIKAPPGYEGADEIPAPPAPVMGTIRWLNADGDVVGPARPRLG